ncbi:hypothetical protein GUJ93_ZPchr0008g13376 [Zizania palustris]|uniref:Reverse transcriptase zinc-binding domain-containing protein n=1 Tax=Zizania palustris TaxID=103762 RepID=A0A8J5RGK5_ZIZPA|nr:hypothetical protein GUJ93_ZPchr0008g13376 [Zizania palustris]
MSNLSSLKFRRNLIGSRFRSWIRLKQMCSGVHLSDSDDSVVWTLSKNGVFSVKSFYKALKVQNLVKDRSVCWDLRIPLKIKLFLWLTLKNKILTKDNLLKRGWKGGSKNCFFCGKDEFVQHLFFDCVVIRFVWSLLKIGFNIGPFANQDHLWRAWYLNLNIHLRKLVGVGLAAVFWTIWKTRNEVCFQNKTVKDPLVIVNLICYWMSSWMILQKSEEGGRKLALAVRLLEHLASDLISRNHGWKFSTNLLGE